MGTPDHGDCPHQVDSMAFGSQLEGSSHQCAVNGSVSRAASPAVQPSACEQPWTEQSRSLLRCPPTPWGTILWLGLQGQFNSSGTSQTVDKSRNPLLVHARQRHAGNLVAIPAGSTSLSKNRFRLPFSSKRSDRLKFCLALL